MLISNTNFYKISFFKNKMGKLHSRKNPGYAVDKSKWQPQRVDKAVNKLDSQERRDLDAKVVKLVEATQELLGEERVPFGEEDLKEPVILVRRLTHDLISDPEIDFAYPIAVYVPLGRINIYSPLSFYLREAESLVDRYEQEIEEVFQVKIISERKS